jgi:radical SAM protein with 4Fe4S-binding SPASM domain
LVVLDQYKTLLTDLDAAGHITLTGGEPFLREDFLDLLEIIADHKPQISFAILTNGSLIDARLSRRLRKLGPQFVQVSMDGAESTHDQLRGSGNFAQVCDAVRELVASRLPTLISFTAHRLNYREFPEVARLGRKLGATRVWADRLIPIGRGSNQETLTPAENFEFIGLMHQARMEARGWFQRTQIPMHRALQFLGGGRPYRCSAGNTLIAVQPNGDVYPCRRLPICVGNVFDQPMSEIYRESEFLCALRDRSRISAGCEKCAQFLRCGGGLRCMAQAVSGSAFDADPGCWLAAARSQLSRAVND